MTEQEAIKEHIKECSHRIKTIKRLTKNNHDADMEKCDSNTKILITAIKALKKQIPKKVNFIHKPECVEEQEYNGEEALYGYCPDCGSLNNDLWNEKNCGDCGQALDWTEE